MPRSTPDSSSSVLGPAPGAGWSETLAMRWMGTCRGESAKAQPLERPRPFSAAMRRSSWYPTSTPSRTMSKDWPATPSSS